jgi:hypothetical protein
LQPASASIRTAMAAASHSFLKLGVILTPTVFPGMNARTWDSCEWSLYRVTSSGRKGADERKPQGFNVVF